MANSTFEAFCGSKFWDYQLTWNTTSPDFTDCFQKTVLLWIPCGLLWVFMPYEIYQQIQSKQRNIPWNGLNITKLVLCCVLSVIALSELIYSVHRHIGSIVVPSVDFYSPFILLVTYVISAGLIITGRKRGIQSSGTLFCFWMLLLLSQVFTYRSRIMKLVNDEQSQDLLYLSTCLISFPLILTQFILTCFADRRPEYSDEAVADTSEEKICPEETSSFLSQILFWWITSFMIRAYKKPLTQDDLWALNVRDRSASLVPKFDKHWERQSSKCVRMIQTDKATYDLNSDGVEFHGTQQMKNPPSILVALIKAYWPMFVVGSVFKLISDVLHFSGPVLLSLLIDFTISDDPLWKGFFIAALLFLSAEIQSIFLNQYFVRMFVVAFHVRTALISAVYRKALRISNVSRKEFTVGEIVNLMSIDTQRFVDVMPFLNMVWSAPLQISLALYLLWGILGPSVLAGLGLMILMIPLNGVVASITRKLQIENMKLKDERTKLMNEVLNGIRVLKLYAWEIPFIKMISKIRNEEIRILTKSAYLSAIITFLWSCAPFLVSLVSFIAYILSDEKNIFDAKTAFVSLTLFNLLRFPINMLPNLITMMIQVSVSVKRLNKFMRGEDLDKMAVTHDELETDPIIVEDSTFAWGGSDENAILNDINLRVAPGSLVAVVGQVGSGKSSLISSILGEMVKRKGRVNVNGSVAFVPQQAWIQNATVRDNVLMYKTLEQNYYDKVIDGCALKSDLEILPGDDLTEIGEKGINLSGGQKQRISLARAVYRNNDIYLLDDPLSAVDSHVGKHIFDNVIGPDGLLKSKTRILVTHGITYLPQCDNIVVLKDGRISESGSYKELLCSKGAFSEFIVQYLNEEINCLCNEDLEKLDEIIAKVPVSPELQRQISRQISHVSAEKSSQGTASTGPYSPRMSVTSGDSTARTRSRSISKSQSPEKIKRKDRKNGKNKLVQDEAMETESVKLAVYAEYMRQIGFILSVVIILLWVTAQAFSVGANIWLSIWSGDAPYREGETYNSDRRNMRLGVYGSFGVGEAICMMVGTVCLAYGTMRAANVLHERMLESVMKSPMSFFDTTPIGRIVNRFSKDVNVMDITISMNLRGFLVCFLAVVSTIIVICMKTPLFLTVILPIACLYYFTSKFYIATSRQLKRLESVSRSPIYSHFSESVTGAASIRAYGVQDMFIDESNNRVDYNMVSYYPSIIANRWLAIRLELVGNFIILFAALFAVVGRDYMDPGGVGLSISYAVSVTATLNWLVRMSGELETNIVSVERIMEYSILESEADWEIENTKPNESWPNEGKLEFSSYATRYREGLDLVLKGITCDIDSRERIGICGRTGAGKSSLTLALFRIIEASRGSIKIDGIDIDTLGLHNLRSRITIIPQDPVLFSGTLRENLDPFNTYNDDKVWTALEHAHLKSFVKGFDNALQHKISEGGENLSVGQRQLVCLARALLRKTKILVLDEATAAVDLETDDLIQETIRKEFADCTILTIAHRLNTIMDSTRVMVLDKGKIIEFDSPSNLLQDNNSAFYSMAKDAGLV